MTECKKCLLRRSGEEDTYKSVQEHIEKIKPAERTEQEEYNHRLAACTDCEHLLSGVCMKCGCYPELRAAFKKQKCPDSFGNKWGK